MGRDSPFFKSALEGLVLGGEVEVLVGWLVGGLL